MKISVIVPAYKAEGSIDRCVSSLINQSLADIEIILVNDGSTDDTLKKCRAWEEKDKRVVVIDQPNGGVSVARNKGLQYATGDYVTFVDADDWVAPDIYEKLLSVAVSRDADMAICSIYHVSGEHITEGNHMFGNQYMQNGGNLLNSLLRSFTQNAPEAMAQVFNKIYKTSIIKENSVLFDAQLAYAEDYLFNICFLKYANRIVFISDHLYYYDHGTENSLSKRVVPYFFDVSIYLNNVFYDLFPNKYDEKTYYNNIRRIQHNSMALYARCKGLKGYLQQMRKAFMNSEVKQASSSEYCKKIRLQEIFPAYAVRHNHFVLYLLWYYTINIIQFAKYYVKRILNKA